MEARKDRSSCFSSFGPSRFQSPYGNCYNFKMANSTKTRKYSSNNQYPYPRDFGVSNTSKQSYSVQRSHQGKIGRMQKRNVTCNSSIEVAPWSEEAKEEERKRQLSDKANKLLNKLKLWNTGKNEKEKEVHDKRQENVQSTNVPSHTKFCENKNSINPAKKVGQLHVEHMGKFETDIALVSNKPVRKPFIPEPSTKVQPSNASYKSNIMKSRTAPTAAEIKQKKIQQTLIGELMTLPKENLKKVLVDPKIHPKIESSMAQIVKENRLILAQKFRNLAESKINDQGQFVCSKFVDDIGNLIDPDLAIDLCQLPPELIKQMGDIFQLDFDSNLYGTEGQESSTLKADDVNLMDCSNLDLNETESEARKIKKEQLDYDTVLENSEAKQTQKDVSSNVILNTTTDMSGIGSNCVKVEPDLLYHTPCSNQREGIIGNTGQTSDPDMEVDISSHTEQEKRKNSNQISSSCGVVSHNVGANIRCAEKPMFSANNMNVTIKTEIETNDEYDNFECSSSLRSDDLPSPKNYLTGSFINTSKTECEGVEAENQNHYTEKHSIVKSETSHGSNNPYTLPVTINCTTNFVNTERNESETTVQNVVQNDVIKQTIETQTEINLIEIDHFKSFRMQLNNESEDSLLEEVRLIDNLVHRLNQRRFLLFLKLVSLPSFNANQSKLNSSFMQTVTNGDLELMKRLNDGRFKS